MGFQLVGKIIKVLDPVIIEGSKGSFTKQEFVLLVEKFYKKKDESYPLKFELWGNKTSELTSMNIMDAIMKGLNVKVDFEISGRQWKDSFFTSLKASTLSVVEERQTNQQNPVQPSIFETPQNGDIGPDFNFQKANDDLPF